MNLFNYIMFIIVMVMSCDIVSYIICMFYFICKEISSLKFISLCICGYIDIIISVCGFMFV